MDALHFDLKYSSLWLFQVYLDISFPPYFRHHGKAFIQPASGALNLTDLRKGDTLVPKQEPFHKNHAIPKRKVKLSDRVVRGTS